MKNEKLISLFQRDLSKVIVELESYANEDDLWENLPGTTNSGGNLAQHLVGNLKSFIGNPFGKIDYVRDRESEFSARLFTREELIIQLQSTSAIVASAVASISAVQSQEQYPVEIKVIEPDQPVEYVIYYLLAHLSYHLGQINYHRRYMNTKDKGNS